MSISRRDSFRAVGGFFAVIAASCSKTERAAPVANFPDLHIDTEIERGGKRLIVTGSHSTRVPTSEFKTSGEIAALGTVRNFEDIAKDLQAELQGVAAKIGPLISKLGTQVNFNSALGNCYNEQKEFFVTPDNFDSFRKVLESIEQYYFPLKEGENVLSTDEHAMLVGVLRQAEILSYQVPALQRAKLNIDMGGLNIPSSPSGNGSKSRQTLPQEPQPKPNHVPDDNLQKAIPQIV